MTTVMRAVAHADRQHQEHLHLEAALNCLANGLVAKGFTFVTSEATPPGRDMPDFAKTISKRVMAFGAERIDDVELATLQQHMRAYFPFCAIAFIKAYGLRFVAIVDGDSMTQSQLSEAMDRFQEINLCMMPLGDRLSIKLFGKSFMKASLPSTGSMIVVTSTTERAGLLRQWVNSKPLRCDTIPSRMKERFTRWQFWAKAVVGIIKIPSSQLLQEVIVLDAQTGQATSTASPRLGVEFGFSLSDVALA